MARPDPTPVDPLELPALAEKVMKSARFPFLASMDGDQARVRPVSPVLTEGFTVYVANLKVYHKTQEIEANPKVELCYLDQEHDQVRITGVAVPLRDADKLQQIWEGAPLLRQYLKSPEDPSLIIYRIEPKEVRFMREWALSYHTVPLAKDE